MTGDCSITTITYRITEENRKRCFERRVKDLIERYSLTRVCEVGAGRTPLLKDEYVRERGLDVTLLDASEEELEETQAPCRKVVADICSCDPDGIGTFDLVYSRSVAEHIRQGELFHRRIHDLLEDGGFSCHHFPTLYALPFVLNLLLPDWMASFAKSFGLHGVLRDEFRKFPAFYSWCRGPTPRQIKRLAELGYDVMEYTGLFGHDHYYRHLGPLREAHRSLSRFLVNHPSPYFTSYSLVVLRKGSQGGSGAPVGQSAGSRSRARGSTLDGAGPFV